MASTSERVFPSLTSLAALSSFIMLGNEDEPLLSQVPQRRGVAAVGFLVDEERYSLRQTLPILLFTKTQFLERGHVFGATNDL
jgi:hypothetical protein